MLVANPTFRRMSEVAGTSSLGLPSLEMEALGRKQFALLDFVQRRARRGDLEKVLCEMLKFARRREWLKIAGGNKSRLLEAKLKIVQPCS